MYFEKRYIVKTLGIVNGGKDSDSANFQFIQVLDKSTRLQNGFKTPSEVSFLYQF